MASPCLRAPGPRGRTGAASARPCSSARGAARRVAAAAGAARRAARGSDARAPAPSPQPLDAATFLARAYVLAAAQQQQQQQQRGPPQQQQPQQQQQPGQQRRQQQAAARGGGRPRGGAALLGAAALAAALAAAGPAAAAAAAAHAAAAPGGAAAAAAGPGLAPSFDLAEGEEFWGNVARYGRYFVTVMLGTGYVMVRPIAGLFKNPLTGALAVAGLAGGAYGLKVTLDAMLGLSAPFDYLPPDSVGF